MQHVEARALPVVLLPIAIPPALAHVLFQAEVLTLAFTAVSMIISVVIAGAVFGRRLTDYRTARAPQIGR